MIAQWGADCEVDGSLIMLAIISIFYGRQWFDLVDPHGKKTTICKIGKLEGVDRRQCDEIRWLTEGRGSHMKCMTGVDHGTTDH